ncbi:hypothetical protein B0H10DRAFT_2251228 [Mycena sp. CBHHK59/15]|nr:hypothetical protein B0H10DRAFT_2251228 [Mycena sp. CBHHK59/15]
MEETAPFCVPFYTPGNFSSVLLSTRDHFPPSHYVFRAALFNVGYAVWKPFLGVTADKVQECKRHAVFLFSFLREAILKFKEKMVDAENLSPGQQLGCG